MSDKIEFLDALPKLERVGSVRKPDPKVVEFLKALDANPGKWAKWPLERKTKPQLGEGYEVASREKVFYARAVEAEDVDEPETADAATETEDDDVEDLTV